MNNFKTFYEAQVASRLKEVIQPLSRWMPITSLEQKFPHGHLPEYTEICFPGASRMQSLGV